MSKKKHRGSHEEGHENGERWLLTYADMVTLLLALFIFLYSISEINVSKLNAFSDAMAEMFNIGRVPESSTSNSGGSGILPEANAIVKLQKKVSAEFKELIDDNLVDVAETEEGLKVRLKDKIIFGIGSSDVTAQAQEILQKLSTNIVGLNNMIRVEGHTDNLPMAKNSRYPSNWELSGARAAAVVRCFIEKGHVDPARLAFAGYAEYHPLYPNRPFLGNAENRRVEIVILRTKQDMVEPTLPTTKAAEPAADENIPDTDYTPAVTPSNSMLPNE